AVRYIAQPLLGGIHAGDVEQLSVRALFPRIATLDREPGSLLEGLTRQRVSGDGDATSGGDSNDGLFRSLPGGLGVLIAAVARDLPADAITVNTTLTALSPAAAASRHASEHFIATLSSGERLETRAVILALPAYAIASLLAPFDAPLSHACSTI